MMYFISTLTLWSWLTLSSTCYLTDLEWETILPDMTSICPFVDFCGRDLMNMTNATTEKKPCCLGCSCDADCHDKQDCCFVDKDSEVKRITSCLEPTTRPHTILPIYKFVTHPPLNGCVIQNGNESEMKQDYNQTCSLDVMVAIWGNFDPVYSKSLDKNYKNEPCALCHGADISGIEHWTSSLTYTGIPLTLSATISDFYENYNSDDVTIVFDPPSRKSGGIDKRCFEVMSECIKLLFDSFHIPPFIRLNRSAINRTCTQGPRAIFVGNNRVVYKNVFCAICNSIGPEQLDALHCNYQHESSKSMFTTFASLLELRSQNTIDTNPNGPKESVACFRHGNELNDSRCVETYCPALQIRLPSGKCDYPTSVMSFACLSLVLHLSTDGIIDDGDAIANLTETGMLSLFEERNPWSDDWLITRIGVRFASNRTEFRVDLVLKVKQANMRRLRRELPMRLSKRWIIVVRMNEKVGLRQRIMKQDYYQDRMPPYYAKQRTTVRHCFEISKTFFCHQIELRPSEYSPLESMLSPLHVTYTNKTLYPYEYTLMMHKHGPAFTVRVCLEDSGYARVNSKSKAELLPNETPCGSLYLVTLMAFVLVDN